MGPLNIILGIMLAISGSVGSASTRQLHAQAGQQQAQAGPLQGLQALTGQVVSKELANASHYILVFLSPECPLCQGYSPILNKLQDQYGQEFPVIGVFPGKAYDDTVYLAFEKKYAIRFVLLKDPDFLMVKKLHAQSTPEAFLLDNKGSVLYSGAIDNKAIALGKWKTGPGKAYLALAIEDVLNNRAVATAQTKAVGCMINDY